MNEHDYCRCGRILQSGWASEIGICDHCQEVPVLEKTDIVNRDNRSKLRDKIKAVFSKYPEVCTCDYCYGRWERYG